MSDAEKIESRICLIGDYTDEADRTGWIDQELLWTVLGDISPTWKLPESASNGLARYIPGSGMFMVYHEEGNRVEFYSFTDLKESWDCDDLEWDMINCPSHLT